MAVIMETSTNFVYSNGRLDPEYFLPIHTLIESKLEKLNCERLGNLGKFICSAFYPAATHLYYNGDMPFLRCVDIIDYPVINEEQPLAKIPKIFVKQYSSIRTLKAGDIVISKVGTPCYTSILSDEMPLSAITRTVLGMTDINECIINKYYLIAYLRSNIGFSQLQRERELTIQYQLTLDRVRNINVYLPDKSIQNFIGDLVKKAYDLKQLSKYLYTQAQELLERELGLDKLKFDKSLTYEAKLSEVVENNRADADFYQTHFKQLRNSIIKYKYGHQRLIDIAASLRPNINPKRHPKKIYNYIELSDINANLGIINSSTQILGINAPSRAKREVKAGDIIASAVVGSVDKAAIVDKQNEGCIASTGFFHFRPNNEILPEFFLLLVRSKCVTMQLQQESTGGILSAVPEERLKNIIIPKIEEDLQLTIGQLVRKSHSNYEESKQLLEQAKHRVEELIEQAIEK